ncbi:hypothetical protein PHMEG_00033823 [Phytophthora megakarya]|uniref:Reverse transcriptase domain-containing protein n=1 Tax=Phytophthora megakarya TaxID=4795 RepID=A0A225USW8_9STRA|nr:hypothetical protein PHMEG_00033823 [Phytophthora megakarya]
MSRPVTVTLADGTIKTCTEEITLYLQLTTAVGVTHVRQMPYLVLDTEDDELFLRRDTPPRLLFDEHVTDALAETDAAVKEMVGSAVRNGYPSDRRGELEKIVTSTREMWSTQVSAGPPARVRLCDDVVPSRCHERNYPALQVEFIHGYIRQLLERSLIRKNNALKWASAVVPVRKPGIDNQFQLTIDYRPVNAQTVPVASRTPTQGEVIDAVRRAKFYAWFDLPGGLCFSPLRVPQGATDSALHFQAQMQTVLALMIPHNVMCSIEDILIFTKDMRLSLAALQKFLDITGGWARTPPFTEVAV